MIWVTIRVAFSSVSAFVRGDFTPGIHTVARENDGQEARDM